MVPTIFIIISIKSFASIIPTSIGLYFYHPIIP
nr:MAG TPA: hypothetical protein [Caudoviricetes sp.]